jgi:hypothetical protein
MQESRQGAGTNRYLSSNLNIAGSQLAGNYPDRLFRVAVFNPEKILRQQFAKAAVNFANGVSFDRTATR